ncbi:MAG: proline--tRNA ligase [Nitrospirae bacterium]|nr:proline--tRNA ligase [Nitrospirota bacterium]
MRWSQAYIPTLREDPSDAEVVSHRIMLKAGMIRKVAAGVYNLLPLGLRSIRKIENIVREEMNRTGAQEVVMPMVIPAELWQETGRWDVYGKELLRFQDRHERWFCLGPTHEEVITDLVRRDVRSHRQLPVTLYQIQTKFRDEVRPRFGLMRGREFVMKDAYSFDRTEKDAEGTYQRMSEAYHRIFQRCGLRFQMVEAATGNIGGSFSHEFMVLADTGEDQMIVCDACPFAANVELTAGTKAESAPVASAGPCPKCGKQARLTRGIEVGHVFKLGEKYSKSMKAVYLDETGSERVIVMGCYGIGIGRTLAAAIEQNHDADGPYFPRAIAPYDVLITTAVPEGAPVEKAAEIERALTDTGLEILFDDRNERAGVKFKDGDLTGIPVKLVVGKRLIEKGRLELKLRRGGPSQEITPEETVQKVREALAH